MARNDKDWKESADLISSEYAAKLGLKKPRLKLVTYIRKAGAWAAIFMPDREVIRIASRRFDELFQRDREVGEIFLRYMIARIGPSYGSGPR